MTITFLDLYNECAGQPWSMFDADAESVDDLESALKISINKALSYIWNLQNWSFRKNSVTIRVKQDKNRYNAPEGNINSKVINGVKKFSIKYNGKTLSYIDDYEFRDEAKGTPEGFYIDGEYLYLYPTPEENGTLKIDYNLIPYAFNANEEYIYELKEDDDYLNVPEKYESLYKNCVISLAMIYAIADKSDENHSGYEKQYEDALTTLCKHCRNGNYKDRNIVI